MPTGIRNVFTVVELECSDGVVGYCTSPAYTNIEAARKYVLDAVKIGDRFLKPGWVADESKLPDYFARRLDDYNWYELSIEKRIVKDIDVIAAFGSVHDAANYAENPQWASPLMRIPAAGSDVTEEWNVFDADMAWRVKDTLPGELDY